MVSNLPTCNIELEAPLLDKLCLTNHTIYQSADAFFYDVEDRRFVLLIRDHFKDVDADTSVELLTMCVLVGDLKKTLPDYAFELLPLEQWPVEPDIDDGSDEITYPDEEETILY